MTKGIRKSCRNQGMGNGRNQEDIKMVRNIEKDKIELVKFMESNIPDEMLKMIKLADEIDLSETSLPIVTVSAQGTADAE